MTTLENDITYCMIKGLAVVVGALGMISSCVKIKYPFQASDRSSKHKKIA